MKFLKLFGSSENEQSGRVIDQKADIKDMLLSDQNRVIHDLKTPLNGISGMVQLLKETELEEEQTGYIAVIEESIVAMLNQIEKLSASKCHDPLPSAYEAVEIRVFLQRLLAHMRSELKERNFGIHYKIDREFPIRLMLEGSLIKKALSEIFIAFFAKRNKDVVIEASYEPTEGYVILVMRDKALTIEDELNSVGKQPFSDLLVEAMDNSTLRYNLMRTIDGKIRFVLYAYYEKRDEASVVVPSQEISPSLLNEIKSEPIEVARYLEASEALVEKPINDGTILIAEDEVVGRVTLKLMLKERYNVVFAKNGKEAVELYFRERPQLVLMDIMMPVMNGFEAFDEIEKNDRQHVPIIACTSKVISTEREYLTSYGFDDHLDKPIENVKLDEILSKYMNG
ncbi:MAG: response regulator [Clostridia bacterium]|nr:response regulator [Clostridia bacterium]